MPTPDRWLRDLADRSADFDALEVVRAVVAAAAAERGWVPPGGSTSDLDPSAVPEHLVDPFLPGAVHEVCADAGDRRRRGAWYTPVAVVRGLVDLVWSSGGPPRSVHDPCAGGGAMLLAAADRMVADGVDPRTALQRISGADVDPTAVAVANLGCWWWAMAHGVDPALAEDRVVLADALTTDAPIEADLVLGNPPFGSPLRVTGPAADADAKAAVASIRATHPGLLGPYADLAAVHLLQAFERLPERGRVAYVMPQSVLTSRDATGLREHLSSLSEVDACWVSAEAAFDAGVRVASVVLRRSAASGPGPARSVVLADGPSVSVRGELEAASHDSWGRLGTAALGAPELRWVTGSGTLGDLARTTAGFRDEYYAIAEAATAGEPDDARPRVVTVGAVDPLTTTWAEREVRLRRRDLRRPVLDVARLDEPTRRWWSNLAVPKIVVATQSRIVEPVVDPNGALVPVTPLIAVVPHDPGDLARLAALLLAPAVSRWLWQERLGAALTTHAITARAADLASIPLPVDIDAWAEAAAAVEGGDVEAVARLMSQAYRSSPDLETWWAARAGVTHVPEAIPE